MNHVFRASVALAALAVLTACGNTDLERAGTGALGGAVVGTAVNEPVAGAAIGAVGGALIDDF
ncbi:hypothetical protein SAMN04488020_102432 [Palleronia marisminoris]|uniref:YMGG-like Gly-zipper domain-containing protein n=1 Tax=Palleronia marisminoris TaxID=315423 RepID=A0A1Y5RSN8_9RHOB|nr:hypothetical protein [Palleronia marisminoris]SFG51797.1 hypothetical protein SAMN04488020_102432 [Palleronia marisminoris]SLN24177.1 hypothetical protein PAM7066_00849 [Palleronia marisminoris]